MECVICKGVTLLTEPTALSPASFQGPSFAVPVGSRKVPVCRQPVEHHGPSHGVPLGIGREVYSLASAQGAE
jgi:hypothetical protein